MKLRKLQVKDAKYMLEWMHDASQTQYLKIDFATKTIDDCIEFITDAQNETKDIHLAITNHNDEYMGTVSLKNIRRDNAELAIVLRTCSMGKGYASFAINNIIEYGHKNRGINNVYWCVDPENTRAVRFYDKNRFQRLSFPDQITGYTDKEKQQYIWYCVKK